MIFDKKTEEEILKYVNRPRGISDIGYEMRRLTLSVLFRSSSACNYVQACHCVNQCGIFSFLKGFDIVLDDNGLCTT